uniref:G_PROTEIN_RECEP_F1_2 domain-containing protein n=1 Tax=Panagrellus redivivus TaxID=6233 RepID=A0A7E4UWV0_PANRE
MLVVDPTLLTVEALARAAVILAVGLLLLLSATISITVLISNKTLHDCIGYFLISLACNDLICALFLVPLSMYSSLSPGWNFFDDNSPICKVSAYLQLVTLACTIYTFAWVSVDRYSAFMKPSRYESDHTLTRCKCWIAFTWVTATLIVCPVVITKMEVNYHAELELCVLNWSSTVAYSLTLAVLVIGPSLCTIIFTSASVFSALQRPEELEDIQKVIIDNDKNFVVTMFTVICFILSWSPFVILNLLPVSLMPAADMATIKFAFMWLAIGGSSSKLLIFFFINPEFRRTFCQLCTGVAPNSESASYGSAEFIDCCAPGRKPCWTTALCCLFCGCCLCIRRICFCCYGRDYDQRNNVSSPVIDERVSSMIQPNQHQQQRGLVSSRQQPEYGSFTRFATGYA